MKNIRDLQKNAFSRLFIPALAVLFVFSLSLHNHSFSTSNINGLDSHSSASHSIEDCSACILQGNLQVPKTGISYSSDNFSQSIDYVSINFAVPHTFVDLNQPSRAPPTI